LIQLSQSNRFIKDARRLHQNERDLLDQALQIIANTPSVGKSEDHDLVGIFVYKFRAIGRTLLVAYIFKSENSIQLIKVGPHENFYAELKREN
jgi:mRNA-degrading endonuclease YafQ of YafQ-DinJ toxin-antitoxin module